MAVKSPIPPLKVVIQAQITGKPFFRGLGTHQGFVAFPPKPVPFLLEPPGSLPRDPPEPSFRIRAFPPEALAAKEGEPQGKGFRQMEDSMVHKDT